MQSNRTATNALIALSLGLMAPAAFADDYPPRKAGLWQMTTKSSTGGAPEVVHQCIDAASDKAMQQAGKAMAQQMCQDVKLRRDGDKVIIESTCAMSPKSKMVSRGVMSGDYQSAYREESETRFDPPMAGIQNVRTTTEAHWVGACKAGQRPGDVVTADGMKMNLLDMVKAGPAMRGKAPAR